MVIRTQKDKKLQTLIEVCTDFASLSSSPRVHRPAEQVFALEEDDDQEEEMFAVVDRQQWNTPEGGGTTSVTGATADVRSRASHGLRDATNLTTVSTPLDKHRLSPKLRIGIIALHLNHATTPGLSVLAVVSWDTLKFAVQNRTHLFRSGQVDGSTGRTDLDGIVEHPHRETKYRPGPNPTLACMSSNRTTLHPRLSFHLFTRTLHLFPHPVGFHPLFYPPDNRLSH